MASYLDSLIFGIRDVVDKLGTKLPTRTAIQFKGAVTVEDDPENKRTIVTVTGGGGGGPIPVGGDLDGDSDDARVVGIQGIPIDDAVPADGDVLTFDAGDGKAKWQAPHVPDAADVAFDPTGTGLVATKVQDAIVELDARPPSSDATKIQGTDVSTDPILTGQTYVKSAGGVLVPRFVSPASDRLITVAGTYTVELGENVYVDVATGDTELKAPASPPVGATFRVKRLSTNANLVVVDGNGATIDGDTAVSIRSGEAALFRCYAAGKWARLGKCEAVGDGAVAHLGLDYSPIAFWKLEGDLMDSSGNGRHIPSASGTYGFATPTAGFTCANVTNGYFHFSNNPAPLAPLFQMTDCTIQAIVNIVPGGERAIMSAHRAPFASIPHWRLAVSNTATIFTWRNSTDTALVTVSAPAIPVGEWVHLAATRRNVDGKMLARVYVNGAKVAEASGLDLPLTTLAPPTSCVPACAASAR